MKEEEDMEAGGESQLLLLGSRKVGTCLSFKCTFRCCIGFGRIYRHMNDNLPSAAVATINDHQSSVLQESDEGSNPAMLYLIVLIGK